MGAETPRSRTLSTKGSRSCPSQLSSEPVTLPQSPIDGHGGVTRTRRLGLNGDTLRPCHPAVLSLSEKHQRVGSLPLNRIWAPRGCDFHCRQRSEPPAWVFLGNSRVCPFPTARHPTRTLVKNSMFPTVLTTACSSTQPGCLRSVLTEIGVSGSGVGPPGQAVQDRAVEGTGGGGGGRGPGRAHVGHVGGVGA